MVNDKMVNMKMYSKPQTETTPIKVVNTLCSSQTVGFGSGAANASNPVLAPGRQIDDPKF